MSESPREKDLMRPVVWLAMLAFFVTLFAFSYLRYRTFKAHVHDLGLISQTLWNTLQGDFFRNSINPEIGYGSSYLGNHFSPGLLAWLPAYALWPSPVTLLFLQALVLALGAWPLYLVLREQLGRPTAAALACAYLLQPGLWFAGLYDFHHETAAATLALWIWWCHRNDRVDPMLLLLAFVASLKEHLPLMTGAFGVYLIVSRERPRLGLAIAIASGAYFAFVLGALVPYFNETAAHSYFARRFPHLGANAREALITCLTRPHEVLGFMLTPRHLAYVLALLGPWLFLPLLAPLVLLVPLPVLFINMQSRVEVSYDIGFYHADSAMPWIALAACAGFAKLARRKRLARLLPALVLANAAYWHLTVQSFYLPELRLPLSPLAHREDYRVTPHHLAIDALAKRIPHGALVSVQANLACFFTDRPRLVPFPFRMTGADFVVLDLTETYAHRPRWRRFWLEFERQAPAAKYCAAVREMLASRDHRVLVHQDGYVVFGRRGAGTLDLEPTELPPAGEVARELEERCKLWEGWTDRGYGR